MMGNWKTTVSVMMFVACSSGAALPAQQDPDGPMLNAPANQTASSSAKPANPEFVVLLEQMKQLVERMDKMQNRINTLDDATKSLVKQEGDRYYPDILGNMALDERQAGASNEKLSSFKDHFMRSVQGHLVIDNFTGEDFYVEVNGVRHFVPRYRTRENAVDILVPFGKVKTQLFWWNAGKGKYDEYPARVWGEEASRSKWKLASKDGKTQLMLPLRIEP